MATISPKDTTKDLAFDPSLYLSPDQQDLLFAALASNGPGNRASNRSYPPTGTNMSSHTNANSQQARHVSEYSNGSSLLRENMLESPIQQVPGSGGFPSGGLNDSPFLNYELEDGEFDWDNSGDRLIGDLPGTSLDDDIDIHEKRKAQGSDSDDEEGGGKRREGDEKAAKKPGRKPLTSEPTSKRKAQNRAAQRAFRERKERHLKELETKVEDLEKASESANHENGLLRAQVEQLQTEVKEYRKRMSLTGSVDRSPPLSRALSGNLGKGSPSLNNNFQFEFPLFGNGMPKTASPPHQTQVSYDPTGVVRRTSSLSDRSAKPASQQSHSTPSPLTDTRTNTLSSGHGPSKNRDEDLNGLFSPSIIDTVSRNNSNDFLSYMNTSGHSKSNYHGSGSSNNGYNQISKMNPDASYSTASPSCSSMSQGGFGSSSGTSPESSAQSPDGHKPSDGGLNTISEEWNSSKPNETADDIFLNNFNGIDWMAQQNGGQFDPLLFGGYRDTQENILNNGLGDFFSDAFTTPDFGSPFNTGDIANSALTIAATSAPPPKRDLMQQIEDHQEGKDEIHVPGEAPKDLLTCNKLWDRLQDSEKVKNGDFDLDVLCNQFKAKAQCTSGGAGIDSKDVERILANAPRQVGMSKKP